MPTILHPAAHDEPALHLPVFPPVFAAADALVFQTEAERRLVEGMFPVASHHQLLLGLGVDDPDERRGDRAGPPGSAPAGRPTTRTWRASAGSTATRGPRCWPPTSPATRSAGRARSGWCSPAPWSRRHPDHPDIDVVGPVAEAAKWDLLGGAVALVSPSPWEAFSLVVAEAWSARTPVLVNAGCAATVEHCRRSGGGLRFDGFGEFEVAVDRLVADPALAAGLGRRGRAYVDTQFRWPVVVDRYAAFLRSVVERGGRIRAAGGSVGREAADGP